MFLVELCFVVRGGGFVAVCSGVHSRRWGDEGIGMRHWGIVCRVWKLGEVEEGDGRVEVIRRDIS